MTWFAFAFGMGLAGFWMIAWGEIIGNDGSVLVGILAWLVSLISFLAAAGVNPINVAAHIGGRASRGFQSRREAARAKHMPSKGFTQGNINIRFLRTNGRRIKHNIFGVGDKFIICITAVRGANFARTDSTIDLYDATNGVPIERIRVSPAEFKSKTECDVSYEIPKLYMSGSRRGRPITGLIEVDVGVNFPTV